MKKITAHIIKYQWIYISLLIPTALMFPVLIWPHYGSFSDVGQIILYPKEIIANFPHSLLALKPLSDGRWNPLFHGLSIFIYFLAPNSPRAFYIAQWLMFLGSSFLITWTVLRITKKIPLSILACFLFAMSSAVFENFYTLDKVEPRITLFSALVIASILKRLLDKDSPHTNCCFIITQTILSICLIFSKETGAYLAASLIATSLFSLFHPSWENKIKLVFFKTAIIHSLVFLSFIVLYQLFSSQIDFRYISYEITRHTIIANARYYLFSSPELLLGLLCGLYWCIIGIRPTFALRYGNILPFLIFISLSEWVYFGGIILWRWPLDYYLLPAQFMSSIITTLSLSSFLDSHPIQTRLFYFVKKILFILCLIFIFYRLLIGILIYNQDAVKDDLATLLANKNWMGHRFILPFSHPDSAELGTVLKFFINQKREPDKLIDLYHFWESPLLNRDNLERFHDAAGKIPTQEQLIEVAKHKNQYVIWQYQLTAEEILEQLFKKKKLDHEIWQFSYLKKGDFLLVPTGSPLLRWINARGISAAHTQTAQDFLDNTPLHLHYLTGVHRELFRFLPIGWDLFEVDEDLSSSKKRALIYTVPSLLALNQKNDIVPTESTKTLYQNRELPISNVLLGEGWWGLEDSKPNRFRWMSKQSKLILSHLPEGNCSIDFLFEPLLTKGLSAVPIQINANETMTTYSLNKKETIHFNFQSSGKTIQLLNINVQSPGEIPPGDWRLLTLRSFSISSPLCKRD